MFNPIRRVISTCTVKMSSTIPQLEELLARLSPTGPPTASFVYDACSTNSGSPSSKSVGILSASFNPPTVAHLMLCQAANKLLKFDQVGLMLTAINADKKVSGASLPQRLQILCDLVTTKETGLDCPVSVVACSHPRFVDMAQALSQLYSSSTHNNNEVQAPTFYFILGYDTLIRVFDTKYYRDMEAELTPFFDKAHVVAFNRADADAKAIEDLLKQPGVAPFRNKIHPCNIDDPLINTASSTEARARTMKGQDTSDLLAPTTIEYIRKANLYKE